MKCNAKLETGFLATKRGDVNSEVGARRASRSVKDICNEAQQEAGKPLVQGESNRARPDIRQWNTDHCWNDPSKVETKGRGKGPAGDCRKRRRTGGGG